MRYLDRELLGSTYSAQLKNGQTIIVKRLRGVGVSSIEFELQMYLLGNIKHENVVTPWGFYFSKDYKLILYDHYKRGSISDMLHGTFNQNFMYYC